MKKLLNGGASDITIIVVKNGHCNRTISVKTTILTTNMGKIVGSNLLFNQGIVFCLAEGKLES